MSAAPQSFEEHFTVAEIAEKWHMSIPYVRRIFQEEPGVVKFGRAETPTQRSNIHIRIPASVVDRVHTRLTVQ